MQKKKEFCHKEIEIVSKGVEYGGMFKNIIRG